MDRRAGGLKELDMTEKTVQMPLPHLLFLFNVEKKNLIREGPHVGFFILLKS